MKTARWRRRWFGGNRKQNKQLRTCWRGRDPRAVRERIRGSACTDTSACECACKLIPSRGRQMGAMGLKVPHSSPNGPRTRGNTHACYASTPLKSISSFLDKCGEATSLFSRCCGYLWLPAAPARPGRQTDRHDTELQATHTQPASLSVCLSLCESLAPSCCGLYFVVKGAPGSFVCRHRRVFWKPGHIRVCEWSEKPVLITLSAPKKPPLKF